MERNTTTPRNTARSSTIEAVAAAQSARDIAKSIRASLQADLFKSPLPPPYPWTWVDVRSSNKHSTVTISWSDGPSQDTVRAIAEEISAGQVEIITNRSQMWSCGYYHQDDLDAWKHHHGQEFETREGGCTCCGEGAEWVLTNETMDRLRAEGHDFTPPCRRRNHTRCPFCHHGQIFDLHDPRSSFVTCPTCNGRGVFDLDNPEHVAVYEPILSRFIDRAWDAWAKNRQTIEARSLGADALA